LCCEFSIIIDVDEDPENNPQQARMDVAEIAQSYIEGVQKKRSLQEQTEHFVQICNVVRAAHQIQ